jgi:ABC-type glycerol-3-phosphate transport system substrate-binding protein
VGSDSFSRTPADTAIAFYTQFADPAKLVYSWSRSQVNARQSFLAGDAAFYVGLASERKLIAAGNPNLDFDMASVPQPQTAATKVDYALAYGFSVPRGSRNAAGAVRTAVALSDAPSEKIAAPALGVAPALRSELAATGDIYSPIVNAAALRAKGWLSPAPAVVDRIFADMINAIITGRQGVHEAILSADEALTAALN